jgi:hypothetical protein
MKTNDRKSRGSDRRPRQARAPRWLPLPLFLAAAPWAGAQPYNLNWASIDGGGGVATGGLYAVSSTVGQPDAGTMSGGNYRLAGGFWGVAVAVQTPGAPFLTITRNPANGAVTVSWPLPASGFLLDETPAVSSPSAAMVWTRVGSAYQTNATHISVTVPAPVGIRYYRLHQP